MPMSAPVQSNNGSLLASGIGALGSLGSSILNGAFNYLSMDKQQEMAKDLMNYQWEHFQSPKAQAQAMAAAGINPAVAFGQGGSGFTATPSPTMPSSSPPSFGGMTDIAGFVKAMAEAKKAGLESVGQDLENQYLQATQAERIRQIGLQNKFTEEQTTKVIQEWNKTIGEINVLQKDAEIKQIDLDKHKELVNSIINHYVSQKNLNDEQANSIKLQLPIILNKLKAEEKILNVDADIAESFKGTMSQLGIVGDVIKIIGQIAV